MYYIITVYNIIYNIYIVAMLVDGRKNISPAQVAIVHIQCQGFLEHKYSETKCSISRDTTSQS